MKKRVVLWRKFAKCVLITATAPLWILPVGALLLLAMTAITAYEEFHVRFTAEVDE